LTRLDYVQVVSVVTLVNYVFSGGLVHLLNRVEDDLEFFGVECAEHECFAQARGQLLQHFLRFLVDRRFEIAFFVPVTEAFS
jgi:hypothetical protein